MRPDWRSRRRVARSIDPPPTPVSVLPPAAPRAVSTEKPNPERKRLIEAFGGVYSAPATQAYLDGVLMKLAPASDASGAVYRVTVLNSPIVNAFSLPSGDIFVTRGLLALADDTSEIAAVMAHEIGHITARHAAQRAEFEKTTALFSRVNSQVLAQREAQDEVEARSKLAIARFSREQEFAADQIGIRTIARAGYDPYGAARFLTALGEWSAFRASVSGAGSANRPDMMSTHPSTPERIAQATEAARQFGAPGTGETGRNAYLAAIDGIAFGDDPSQGVVRDNAFIHPKLGFAFDAPEGFTLDNQPAALIGVGEAGGEALRLDSIAIPESTPVTTAIGSDWIDGVKTTSIESEEDRRPGGGDRDRSGRPVELPPWGRAPERTALSPHLRRPQSFARRRLALHGLARFVSSDQCARLRAGRAGKDQDCRGDGRRHPRNAGRADGLPAAMARSVPDPQRPRAGRRRSFPGSAIRSSSVERRIPRAPARARRLTGRLVVATHNPGKLREIEELLEPFGLAPVGAAALGLDEPEETGSTFRDNAASEGATPPRAPRGWWRLPTIPGSASRRSTARRASIRRDGRARRRTSAPPWPGSRASSKRAPPRAPWRAAFISVLALAWPDGAEETFEGRVDGTLVFPPRGTAGFGYDPIFLAGRP